MNRLDLLLINPGGAKKRVYQELSKDYSAIEPPFWAAITAGFARKRKFDVKIIDANAENLTPTETAELVNREYSPKLINIVVYGQHPSASTQLMTSVGLLCEEIKRINPKQKIILTGLHPSALPQRTLQEESCDFVCQGEGFYTIEKLLKEIDFENIPGLWWREKEKIKGNPRGRNIENLTEELSEIAWDLLPMKRYRAHNWQCLGNLEQRPYYASLSTSLGCPFKCDFCSIHSTFGERRVRTWSPEWIVKQLEILQEKYSVQVIKVIDEMFVLNPNHFIPITEEINRRDLKFNIWAYARVDTTKEEYLERLKNAGFNWLCLGFESGNEQVRKNVEKGRFTQEDIFKVAELTKNSGINILGNFMFGLPQDDEKSMEETFKMAQEMNCEFANFYCTIAWPGSKLYEESLKQKIRFPTKWEDYAQHAYGFIPLPTKYLPPEKILKFRDESFGVYYSNPKYLKMIEEKFGKLAKEHIEGMVKFKLKRKILGE